MKATRVGSFDNQLYRSMMRERFSEYIPKEVQVINAIKSIDEYCEKIEKQIADSHDITKSSFGIEDW